MDNKKNQIVLKLLATLIIMIISQLISLYHEKAILQAALNNYLIENNITPPVLQKEFYTNK